MHSTSPRRVREHCACTSTPILSDPRLIHAGGAGGGRGPTWGSLHDEVAYQQRTLGVVRAWLDHGDPNYDPDEEASYMQVSGS